MLYPGKTVRSPYLAPTTRANLRACTADGAAFGAMVGLGETYLAAFALAIGLGEISAGLISSLPMLAGGLLQMVSLRAVQWMGSEKRWVVCCAAVQSLAFIPLVIAALVGSISMTAMLIVASVYWAAGLASGPAWNTWMQSIVPQRVRAKYFAKRTRASQFTTLGAFLGGGILLQWSRGAGVELQTFAALFALAMLFRMTSTYCLYRQEVVNRWLSPGALKTVESEAKQRSGAESQASLKSSPTNVGRKLLVFLIVMQGMIQLSGPYFAPFMLEELQYSYLQFALLIGVAFATKGLAFSLWARWAQERGPGWLLWMGAVGIVPIASLWLVSQNFYWLLFVQMISGTAWAAYELGFFLMFFEALPVQKRTRMLTFYNLGNTTAWCLGALVGAGILATLGTSHSSYLTLFGLSSIGRAMAVLLLARTLPPSTGLRLPVRKIGLRILSLRPGSGGFDVPILPSIPSRSRRAAAKSL